MMSDFTKFECEQPMECGETCVRLFGHRDGLHRCEGHDGDWKGAWISQALLDDAGVETRHEQGGSR